MIPGTAETAAAEENLRSFSQDDRLPPADALVRTIRATAEAARLEDQRRDPSGSTVATAPVRVTIEIEREDGTFTRFGVQNDVTLQNLELFALQCGIDVAATVAREVIRPTTPTTEPAPAPKQRPTREPAAAPPAAPVKGGAL